MPVKRYDGTNWVTVAGEGIQGPAGADGTAPLTTKGQLLTRNSSAVTALGVGSDGTILTADSAEATGLKWSAPAGGYVGCSVYKSAGQAISSGSNTLQTFDLELFDTDAFHSTTTNTSRLTVPTGQAGKYLIVAHSGLGQAVQSPSPYWVWIEKNGSNIGYNTAIMTTSGMANRNGIVTVADLAVGDYIQMYVYYSDSSTGQETPSGVGGTFLSISKL